MSDVEKTNCLHRRAYDWTQFNKRNELLSKQVKRQINWKLSNDSPSMYFCLIFLKPLSIILTKLDPARINPFNFFAERHSGSRFRNRNFEISRVGELEISKFSLSKLLTSETCKTQLKGVPSFSSKMLSIKQKMLATCNCLVNLCSEELTN